MMRDFLEILFGLMLSLVAAAVAMGLTVVPWALGLAWMLGWLS
jgi:hypothetical protein